MPGNDTQSAVSTAAPTASPRLWIGYVTPMIVFTALTFLEGAEGTGIPYPALYAFKIIMVTIALVMSRKVWKEIEVSRKMLCVGLLFGAIACAAWICVDRFTPHFKFLGSRTGYNPIHEIPNVALRTAFLGVRFYGLVIVVPVMEEFFWRSFLLRWITEPDFTKLKLGQFSWKAFATVAGLFALSHPEWLAAALFAAAIGLLLKRTGSLFTCIVAHATTNLLLGIYVMQTHAWKLW